MELSLGQVEFTSRNRLKDRSLLRIDFSQFTWRGWSSSGWIWVEVRLIDHFGLQKTFYLRKKWTASELTFSALCPRFPLKNRQSHQENFAWGTACSAYVSFVDSVWRSRTLTHPCVLVRSRRHSAQCGKGKPPLFRLLELHNLGHNVITS